MSKVYLIATGEYSDYHIVTAFSTKELADKFMALYGSDYKIVISWLDTEVPNIESGLMAWVVEMYYNGGTEDYHVEQIDDYVGVTMPPWGQSYRYFSVYAHHILPSFRSVMMARDKKHAIKIANERRTQMIANGEWSLDGEIHPANVSDDGIKSW